MMRVFGRILVVIAALVLAASFAGDFHRLGDSLAVFRPIILVGSLFIALLVWQWRGAQVVILATLLVGLWHGAGLALYEAPKDDADIILYQKNMLFRARDRTLLIDDIRAAAADVVTLQEVSSANLPTLEALRDLYPYQLLCTAHTVGGVAVLSRSPLKEPTCGQARGLARAVTRVNGQDVQVVSLHVHWPFPYTQQAHVRALIQDISPLQNVVTVIGGDFNMVASGRSLAWIEEAAQAKRVGPWVRSFNLFGYPLGIDHVLASGGTGALSVRPQLGSDHYGLLAFVEFP